MKKRTTKEALDFAKVTYYHRDDVHRDIIDSAISRYGQIPNAKTAFRSENITFSQSFLEDLKRDFDYEILWENRVVREHEGAYVLRNNYITIRIEDCYISMAVVGDKPYIFQKIGQDIDVIIENVSIQHYLDTKQELLDKILGLLYKWRLEIKRTNTHIALGYIVTSQTGASITRLSVPKKFDIAEFDKSMELCYGSDFNKFHTNAIAKMKNLPKGLMMLHGDTGTGKSYYLRRLLYQLAEEDGANILMISPDQLSFLVDPHFIKHFISWCVNSNNNIIIIEDAENLLESRDKVRSSGISSLLNMTDGILNDLLQNLKIICTFNTKVENIDPALLRKERLIAIKRFDKLKSEDAIKLAMFLGVEEQVRDYIKSNSSTRDFRLSISDIFAFKNETVDYTDASIQKRKPIGFVMPIDNDGPEEESRPEDALECNS